MAKLTTHWTERSIDDLLYSIGADFVRHIEGLLESQRASQATLAKRLGVTEGRISQVLGNPGNLTLRQIIRYARALGEKVAIVSYNDNDPKNLNGPVPSEVFQQCWKRAGRPADLFEVRAEGPTSANSVFALKPSETADYYVYVLSGTAGTGPNEQAFAGKEPKTASTLFRSIRQTEFTDPTGVESNG